VSRWKLAWRQTRRDMAAGEVRLMVLALMLAVMAVTAVGMLTERAEFGLRQEANRLLGGDAALRADTPIPQTVKARAKQLGLAVAQTAAFPSMVQSTETVSLAEIRAVDTAFPLRGQFEIQRQPGASVENVRGGPKAGTVWLSPDAARKLKLGIGDRVGVGELQLEVSALLVREPDAALDYFNVAPKVLMAMADLPASGLVQPGSRIQYRMVVAGTPSAVSNFSQQQRAQMQRGQRLETADDARPEIRSALDRANRFLSLAALVSLILAAVAVALAARRHSQRHLDASALMRCMGASQATLVCIQLGELFILGMLGTSLGVALAWALQFVLGQWLGSALGVSLPAAGGASIMAGFAVGFTVLTAFAVPPVLALRRVSALRVLRRDVPLREASAVSVALLGLGGLAALLWWKAGSATLGTLMLGGIAGTAALLAATAGVLLFVLKRIRNRLQGPWRYGLANLSRHQSMTITQVTALGIGLMALLLLLFVRTDLLGRWQQTLPADAPNRFVINVQSEQVAGVAAYAKAEGLAVPSLYPMVRARLVAVNGKAVRAADFAQAGDRARRLAEREFNLSSSARFSKDNTLIQGSYWPADYTGPAQISVEEGFAEALSWKLGDRVRFDVAGTPLEAEITSLRKVEWESFKPNFFVVVSPGALNGFSASYISAVHLPGTKAGALDGLIRTYPNISIIDIDAVLLQVRNTVEQVSRVVEAVFYFSLLAGLLVLAAAVQASQDERLQEAGVMRVLGASKRQLRLAQATEFGSLGFLAGLVAALAASTLAGLITVQVFGLPWRFETGLLLYGVLGGTLLALVAGLWTARKVTRVSPMTTLRAQ